MEASSISAREWKPLYSPCKFIISPSLVYQNPTSSKSLKGHVIICGSRSRRRPAKARWPPGPCGKPPSMETFLLMKSSRRNRVESNDAYANIHPHHVGEFTCFVWFRSSWAHGARAEVDVTSAPRARSLVALEGGHGPEEVRRSLDL